MKTSGKGLQRLPRKPEAHSVASELSLQGKKNTEIRSRLRSSRPATADCNALVPARVKAPGAAGPGLAWQEPPMARAWHEGTASETPRSDPEHLGLWGPPRSGACPDPS